MRNFILSILSLVLFSSVELFGLDLGKPLPLAKRADGSPDLSLVYAYDEDWAWMATYRTALKTADIEHLPDLLRWQVYAPKANKVLASGEGLHRTMLLLGQIGVTKATDVRKILLAQTDLMLVFSRNEGGVLYSLSLKRFCKKYPSHVKDLSNASALACRVEATELSKKAAECVDFKAELIAIVEKGKMDCALAQQYYELEGCGKLICR